MGLGRRLADTVLEREVRKEVAKKDIAYVSGAIRSSSEVSLAAAPENSAVVGRSAACPWKEFFVLLVHLISWGVTCWRDSELTLTVFALCQWFWFLYKNSYIFMK